MQTRGFALPRRGDPNLSREQQFQRAGPIWHRSLRRLYCSASALLRREVSGVLPKVQRSLAQSDDGRTMNGLSKVASPRGGRVDAAEPGALRLANATTQRFQDRAATFGRVIVMLPYGCCQLESSLGSE